MSLHRQDCQVIAESTPLMVRRCRSNSECDYVNSRWSAFRGRGVELEYGVGWMEGVHPADFDRWLRDYLRAFYARAEYQTRYRLRRHDGVYRWVTECAMPCCGPQEEFFGYLAMCVDVTESMEAANTEQREAEAQERHPAGIVSLCAHCRRIRDDESGLWQRLEEFLRVRLHADLSHGICPDCRLEFYGTGKDEPAASCVPAARIAK